jgi:hypothetical protein
MSFGRILVTGVLAGSLCSPASADPWLAPGDEGVRSDIQLLADAGVLKGPVTTWPISWPDISRDALAADSRLLDSATQDALARVQRLARASMASGFGGVGVRAAAAHEPPAIRGFADTPREEGEAGLKASWLGDRFAANLQGTVVVDPDDDREFRPDGSYLGVNIGNFMISAGWMERWWGPGWDSSLILSTNARPIPTLTIERSYADPFETKLLSWLGPWRASIAVGQTEEHEVARPNTRFFAARVNIRPVSWFELGVSRTAQWCGDGRPCGWKSFADMLVGNDNQEVDGSVDAQPGNQMAGYDLRMRSPWRRLPLAIYTQWIGEDEAGGLPSKFIGQFGLEAWAATPLGNARAHVEYSDTACNFSREEPEFNCAYRNTLYPQGYSYRGRNIGHPLDNDGRLYVFGVLLTRPNGDFVSANLRRAEVNRDGAGRHPISSVPFDVDNVELRYSRSLGAGKIIMSVAYDHTDLEADTSSDFRGYLSWQQGF